MARTSAKAKKQRQEVTRNRDKGEESADSLPSDNQENIENGAQKEKPNRKTITKTQQEEEQDDSDFENDASDSEKRGKKRAKVENSKRKEKKMKREKSASEDEEDKTPKNDFENDVSDTEKKGKKKGKVENSKPKEKKLKKEKSEREEEDDEEQTSTTDYDVEKIVEVHHKKNGKREFLIRWKGFSSKDDTWEPEENLHCPALIDSFMAKVDKAKNLSVRELRDQSQRTPTQRFTPRVPGVRTSHRNHGKARTVFYTE